MVTFRLGTNSCLEVVSDGYIYWFPWLSVKVGIGTAERREITWKPRRLPKFGDLYITESFCRDLLSAHICQDNLALLSRYSTQRTNGIAATCNSQTLNYTVEFLSTFCIAPHVSASLESLLSPLGGWQCDCHMGVHYQGWNSQALVWWVLTCANRATYLKIASQQLSRRPACPT